MKTRQEIINEIEIQEQSMRDFKEEFLNKKFPQDIVKQDIEYRNMIINTLKWVLGDSKKIEEVAKWMYID